MSASGERAKSFNLPRAAYLQRSTLLGCGGRGRGNVGRKAFYSLLDIVTTQSVPDKMVHSRTFYGDLLYGTILRQFSDEHVHPICFKS